MSNSKFNEMSRLKMKTKDPAAQIKFKEWYSALSAEERAAFDKYEKKTNVIAVVLSCVLVAGVGFWMFGGSGSDSESTEPQKVESIGEWRSKVLGVVKDKAIKAYMKTNSIDEKEYEHFRACMSEFVNTKDRELKTDTVMGWCATELKNNKERFDGHIDLDPFFRGFSLWDGSYDPLEKAIKKSLNDPSSYKHDETTYRLVLHSNKEPYAIVETKFRAKNAFNAMIKCGAVVEVDLKTMNMKIISTQGL